MSTRPRTGAAVLIGIAAFSCLLSPAALTQDGVSRSSSSRSESRRVVVQNGEVVVDEHIVDGVRQPSAGGRGLPAPGIGGIVPGGIPDLDRMVEDMLRRVRAGHDLPELPALPGLGGPGSGSARADSRTDARADAGAESTGASSADATPAATGSGAVRPPAGSLPAPADSHPAPLDLPRDPAPRAPGVDRPGRDRATPLPIPLPTPNVETPPSHPRIGGTGLRRRDPRGNDAPPPVFVELPQDRPAPPPAPSTGRPRRSI